MAISAVSSAAAGAYASSQPPLSAVGQHKHGGHHSRSMTDIDGQGSSVATAPSSTGKIGSKVDMSA
jgi:hypothetical protein